jgi:hypothetical protein
VRLQAAKIWSKWEGTTSKLLPGAEFTGHYEENEFASAVARIEVHFFVNRVFLKRTTSCCNAGRIRHILGMIVQGRYDVVCPMESALALHRAWPEADLIITLDSGHSAFGPPNSRALVAATGSFGVSALAVRLCDSSLGDFRHNPVFLSEGRARGSLQVRELHDPTMPRLRCQQSRTFQTSVRYRPLRLLQSHPAARLGAYRG